MHIFIEWKNKKHTKEKIRYGAVLSILLIFLFLRGVGIVASSTYDSCTGGRLTIDQIPGVNPFDKEPLTQVEQEKKEYVESLGERITLRYSSQGIESDSSLGEKRIITSGHVLKKPNSWNNGSVKDASGLEYYKFEPSQRLGLIEEDRILIGKKCFDNIHLCSTIYLNGAAVNISTESDNQNILDHYYKMIEFDEKQPLRSTSVDYY